MSCYVVRNNEIFLNEAHSNNFIFVLERIPSSFLLSKFSNNKSFNLDGTIQSITKSGMEYIREANQDTQNFALFLQSVTLPDINLQTAVIETKFTDLKAVTGKIEFGTLTTNILGDENWFIYRMILYWFYCAYNPEEFNKLSLYKFYENFYISAKLLLLNNHKEKVLELEFRDLHPQNLGQVDLNYREANKIVIPVTWVYSTITPSDDYKIIKMM
ncbi:MAG: hypothetical protein NZZ41_01060 [Candidatus Dojkabacteria bacterium]|nr:hypothetical protein [Candidatus Dojkabacteria bacterium]